MRLAIWKISPLPTSKTLSDKIVVKVSRLSNNIPNKSTQNKNAMAWYTRQINYVLT